MGKFKTGFAKEAKETLRQEEEQKHLHEKHGIEDQNTVVIEKSNMTKFLIRCVGKIFRIAAAAMVFILAAIGLLALIYPEIRSEVLQVLQSVLGEARNMTGI